MNLLVFKPTNDFNTFIEFWSQFYNYNSNWEPNYEKHIKYDKPFTHHDILQLFEFITQCGLGKIRTAAIKEKIYPHLDYINDMKFEEDIVKEEFLEKFIDVAAVSQIALLHFIKPFKYPLYDQNVQIAYNYIQGLDIPPTPFPKRQDDKINFYFRKFIPFVETIKGKHSMKKIDEALNSFGYLIKKNPKIKFNFGEA